MTWPPAAEHGPFLVTGGSGFVGANLVRRLLDLGAQVHVVLRDPGRAWRLADVLERLTVHEASLVDGEGIARAVEAARPGVVYHLAAYGAYEHQADPTLILQTNILGTRQLIAACQRTGVGLLVSTGSSSEYGFKSAPMRESDVLEPNSFYAVAKAAQTHLCRLASARGELATVTLRLFSIYGPWEEPTRLMPTILRRARAGEPLEMTSPETARDFVYVDDVVRLMLDVPRLREQSGGVFNAGSGIQTRLKEVVEIVLDVTGRRLAVGWGEFKARQWDTNCWVADPNLARERLGWEARTTVRAGLEQMAEWMQSVGDHYGPRTE